MTTRTHLSIGEVLSLLTDDFPDLTITKIRFLESQGLIDPERTASGYRKFYDFDIERLRWILRQQRENFLPLKVIKDRLDRSEGKLPTQAEPVPAQAELNLARDPGTADPPPVWMADHAKTPRDRNGGGNAAATPDPAPGGTEAAPAPTPDPAAAPGSKASPPAASGTERSHRGGEPNETGAPAGPDPGPSTRADPGAHGHGKHQADKRPAAPPRADETRTRVEPPMPASPSPDPAADPPPDVSDVSLTRAELLAAAKLEERQLAQLESFGIVVPTDGFDDPLYGAEALVCARQAAIFLDLGMEPRHLRAFKVAADREAGLYEQMILPLLRQRNPTARSEATKLVGRLTTAGAAIHAALLEQSLRGQLRPRR